MGGGLRGRERAERWGVGVGRVFVTKLVLLRVARQAVVQPWALAVVELVGPVDGLIAAALQVVEQVQVHGLRGRVDRQGHVVAVEH